MLYLRFLFPPCFLQRQPAFDTFDGSLFAVLPSLNEEQALQEVPTGLDTVSHGNLDALGPTVQLIEK